MTSIFSSNFNTINATSTFGGTLFNNIGSGSYGSTSGLFNGNTYGSSGLFGSNFGYGGYGYFGNTFGSYFGSPWGSLGSIWGQTTTPVVTPTDTVTRTTGTTIATKQTDEEDNLSFVATDFAYLGGEVAASMQITDLPDHGTLEVDGHEVSLNETIGVDEFDNMDYIPDDDFDGTDTFSVKLSEDGATYDSSNSIIQINVLGENDAPDMNTLPTFSVAEGGTLDFFGDEIIAAFTDVDTGDYLSESVVEFESGEEFGELTYISDAGSTITIFHDEDVTLSANEISTLQFVAGADSVDDEGDTELVKLRLRPSDSEGEQTSGSHYLTIQVTDVDDAPTFDDDSVEYNIDENQLVVTDDSDELYLAEDEESQNTLEYSISGLDADLFEVNNLNGEISFISAPDYEDPQDSNGDNFYYLDLTVTDEAGQTATQAVEVEVKHVASELTLSVPSAVTVVEGETAVTTATFVNDDSGNGATFSIVGGADEDLFEINEDTGVLTFKTAQDAENPSDTDSDGSYDVKIQVEDETVGDTSSTTASIEVNLEDIHDEAPEFDSATLGSSFSSGGSSAENALAVTIAENTSSTTEVITIKFKNGESSLTAANTPALNVEPDFTFALDSKTGAENFTLSAPDVSSGATVASAVISLAEGATLDYEADSEVELTLKVTDNDSGETAETSVTINVGPVNEPPVYTAPEDQQTKSDDSKIIGDYIVDSMDDPEDDELYFVIQSPDSQVISINGTNFNNDYGDLYYDKNGFSGADQWIIDDSYAVLDEVEVSTLEYFGWDTDVALETENDSDASGAPDVKIKYWAFDDEAAAEAYESYLSDMSSTEPDNQGIQGYIELVIIDAEI